MDPAIAVAVGGGLVVLALGIALGLVWSGHHFAQAAVSEQRARAERAEADLAAEQERRREDARRAEERASSGRDGVAARRALDAAELTADDAGLLRALYPAARGDPAAPAGGAGEAPAA